MHFPVPIVIGPWSIGAHAFFTLLALAVGFSYYYFLKTGDTFPKETRFDLMVAAFLGGVFGARILNMLYEIPSGIVSKVGYGTYFLFGGKTVVGSLVGGVLAVEAVKWWRGIKQSSGDLFTYPLIIGIAIGRIGCFLTGVKDDTAGLPSSVPWALDQGDGIPRHPTALYEILFLLLLFLVLKLFAKRVKLAEGVLFRLFLISYLTFRFFVDFLKPSVPFLFHLTAIQLACLLMVAWYAIRTACSPHFYGPRTTESFSTTNA